MAKLQSVSKSRTIKSFKSDFHLEKYIFMDMPKSRRSLLAQFRFDVFLTEKKQDNEGGGGEE